MQQLAGWLAGRLAGWPAGRQNPGKLKFLKFIVDQIFKLFTTFSKATALLEEMNAFKLVFSAKVSFKVVVRSVKIGKAIVFLVNP